MILPPAGGGPEVSCWRAALTMMVLSTALAGCSAPTVPQLRAFIAAAPNSDPFTVVRAECVNDKESSGCREMFRQLCVEQASAQLHASAGPFLSRRLAEVGRVALESAAECSPSSENRRLVQVAEALDRCDREAAADSGCELEILVELAESGPLRPPLSTYVAMRRRRLCAWRLSQARAAGPASGARGSRARGAKASDVDLYVAAAAHCSQEERGQLREGLIGAFEQGLGRKGPTYTRLGQCRRVRAVDETDEPVRQLCESLATVLGTKVTSAANTAAKAKMPGLALGLVGRAGELGVAVDVPAGTVKGWQAALRKESSWQIELEFKNRSGANGELATQTLDGMRMTRGRLPQALEWRPAGAVPDARTIDVDVTLGSPFRVHQRKSQRRGTSQYVSGHRTVENPRWAQLQQACLSARNALKRCYQRSAREKQAADQCAATRQRIRSELESCHQQRLSEIRRAGYSLRTCMAPPIFCSTSYTTCNANHADPICEQSAGEPQTKQVPVYSNHSYRIHKVRQTASMSLRVVAHHGRALLHDARFQVSFDEADEHVAPEPAYNVSGDPLQLSDESEVIADLARKAVTQLSKSMEDVTTRLCDGLLAKEEKAVRASATRRSLHAIAVARRAGCDESDEQRDRASALMERFLSGL